MCFSMMQAMILFSTILSVSCFGIVTIDVSRESTSISNLPRHSLKLNRKEISLHLLYIKRDRERYFEKFGTQCGTCDMENVAWLYSASTCLVSACEGCCLPVSTCTLTSATDCTALNMWISMEFVCSIPQVLAWNQNHYTHLAVEHLRHNLLEASPKPCTTLQFLSYLRKK